jgi:serine/threonine protein kinase
VLRNIDLGSRNVRRQVTREVRALHGARHPHVVSYHDSFFADGTVTILMEHMDGGTLWDLLQKVWCRVGFTRSTRAAAVQRRRTHDGQQGHTNRHITNRHTHQPPHRTDPRRAGAPPG